MKFMVFVPCCGSAAAMSRPETPERPSATEETRSLVLSPLIRRRRKRGRLGGSPPGSSAAEWKPSLCSISEDHDVFEKSGHDEGHHHRQRDRTVGSERLVKRKSSIRSPKRNFGSYNDDYGRSSFPSVIPAFAPTPFMF